MIKPEWYFMRKEELIWGCSLCGSYNNINNNTCGKCKKKKEITDIKL
tara:strand:+ start:131 stop:271 length:141 start_codon:yes stop_codon:yes gene_type:complete